LDDAITQISFHEFLTQYQKSYPDPLEYQRRQAIFTQNLQTIVEHNQQYRQNKRGHYLGVTLWADQEAHELPRGYDKSQSNLRLSSSSSSAAATTNHVLQQHVKQDIYDHLPFSVEPVHLLPKAVDWRAAGVTTPVKNQGRCGSCWAFASTAVLESHIALTTNKLMTLSVQELVSCAPNPQHCGGTGGCAGATAELAFQHVAQHGMVQEWEFGYQSYHGEAVNCSLSETTRNGFMGLRGGLLSTGDAATTHYTGAVAGIEGYMTLPSNDYVALMNAVAKHGPVAVSVACLPWHLYQGGVFYAPLNNTRATDIGRFVGNNETVFLLCFALVLLCVIIVSHILTRDTYECAQIIWSYWRDTEKIP
jgi:cathepsin L